MRLHMSRLMGQPSSLYEVRTKLRSMAPYMVSHKPRWESSLARRRAISSQENKALKESVIRKVRFVEGFLSLDEAQLLSELSSRVSEGCIVEVGSYRGRSTVALALGAQHGSNIPVYAIEPHEQFEGVLGGNFGPRDRVEFFFNMLRTNCAETVRVIGVSSEVVTKGWDKPIGLLWIDGDHRYEAVKRDFMCWEPFILRQGLVAFHDSIDEDLGPAKVIEEALARGGYQKLQQVKRTTVLRKVEPLIHLS